MDGNAALIGVGIVVGLNSLVNITALIKVHGIGSTLTQYMKGTDSALKNHKDRIIRLEDSHMDRKP